jgi:hypothetical protein
MEGAKAIILWQKTIWPPMALRIGLLKSSAPDSSHFAKYLERMGSPEYKKYRALAISARNEHVAIKDLEDISFIFGGAFALSLSKGFRTSDNGRQWISKVGGQAVISCVRVVSAKQNMCRHSVRVQPRGSSRIIPPGPETSFLFAFPKRHEEAGFMA